jgi:hypothetical protein
VAQRSTVLTGPHNPGETLGRMFDRRYAIVSDADLQEASRPPHHILLGAPR